MQVQTKAMSVFLSIFLYQSFVYGRKLYNIFGILFLVDCLCTTLIFKSSHGEKKGCHVKNISFLPVEGRVHPVS